MQGRSVIGCASFLDLEDATARLIAEFDWSATALGPISAWPHGLRGAVGLIVRSAVPMALLWGDDGYLIYNHAYTAIAGRRHPDALGRKVREAWPEVAEFNAQAIRTCLDGGTARYRDQPFVLDRNGVSEQIWVSLDYSAVPGDDGTPGGVIVIVAETTERVFAEQQVAAEQERLRAMFAQAPGFMAMLSGPDHRYTMVNPAYDRLLGARELLGRCVREVVPEVEGQGFLRLLDKAFTSGKPVVGRGQKLALADADGRLEDHYVDFVYQPILDTTGSVTGLFVQGSDVTERVLAEHALREGEESYKRLNNALIMVNETLEEQVALRTAEIGEHEAKLRALFAGSFRLQGLLSADGLIREANRTAVEAAGTTIEQLRDRPFSSGPWFCGTPGAEDTVRDMVARARAGEGVRRDLTLDLPVGGRRRFDLGMRPIRDANGAIEALALEFVDLDRAG